MPRLSNVVILCMIYAAMAVEVGNASDQCKYYYGAALREAGRVMWTTTETAARGFLLGFGGAILKDLVWTERKAVDFKETLKYARLVGLGSSSFVVGVALFMPARLRYEAFRLD